MRRTNRFLLQRHLSKLLVEVTQSICEFGLIVHEKLFTGVCENSLQLIFVGVEEGVVAETVHCEIFSDSKVLVSVAETRYLDNQLLH